MGSFLHELMRAPKPEWRQSIEASTKAVASPIPRFDVQISSVASYDLMFAGSVVLRMRDDDLLREALANGRVLLSGRGGGAKTVILERLAKRALKMGLLPVLLSLKSWTQMYSETWRSFDSSLKRIDFLIRSLSNPSFGVSDLDNLDPSISRILIVDGLNEVDGKIAQELILALDEYASAAINTSVIVSDRLVRREFVRPERWSLFLVLPLSKSEVNKHVSKTRFGSSPPTLTDEELELLSSPYFLDAYLRTGQLAKTRAEEMRKWFEAHVGLTTEDLVRASRAAYSVYGSSSRTFNIREFEKIAGSNTTTKLTESGSRVLLVNGEVAMFDHHLKHDFLASKHVADNIELWNKESFDHVTFSGSSFDAIMMCVEQISERAADRFVRAVYDWNLYAVGYALGESRRHNVSAEMRTVILAMFAEKKWDAVAPTKQRAHDTLLVLRDKDAARFLNAESLEDVFQLVTEQPVNDGAQWFDEWKLLFTRRTGSEVEDAVVELLKDRDSVRGWTTANVLKRSNLSESQQQLLRSAVEHADAVVRWRAAHALGAFASQPNAEALLNVLHDVDRSVRYGAVRSLLELASVASADLRRYVFESMLHERANLVEFSSVREEIRRCVLIPEARNPHEWLNYCLKLMSAVQPVGLEAERDKWNRAAQELINMFAETGSQPNA